MSDDKDLPVKKEQQSLVRISRQLAITNKILSKTFDARKWWEGLDREWKTLFKMNLRIPMGPSDNFSLNSWMSLQSQFRYFPNYEIIEENIQGIERISINELQKILLLRTLSCEMMQIDTLEPLRNLTNLKALICGGTHIATLEPLRNLTNLEALDCAVTAIDSLEPLMKHNGNLSGLYCWKTRIATLEPLRNFDSLRWLDCENTRIKTLEPLRNLTNLEILNCAHTEIDSLKPLWNISKLKQLWCNNTNVDSQDINNLQKINPGLEIYSKSKSSVASGK